MLSKRVNYMANGNNYIEDFFISIGFDTKKVQKDVNEINRILKGLGKGVGNEPLAPITPKPRQVKNELSIINKALQKTHDREIKREMDLHKVKTANQKKQQDNIKKAVNSLTSPTGAGKAKDSAEAFIRGLVDTSNRKAPTLSNQQRDTSDARKKAVENLTSGNSSYSAKDSAEVFKAEFAMQDKLYKAERKAEAENFKFFLKKEKARQDEIKRTGEIRKEAMAMGESLKYTRSYQQLKSRGKLGDFDGRIANAVAERDIRSLKNLKTEMNSVATATRGMQRQMLGLGVVQRGLNDSTRNMIRSYASVFALFQGTVAIKRIGQDFQGMEASMLAASGSIKDAGKDTAFVNSIVDEMGLSLKDTTDAFVKFKFAAKGKMQQTDIEALFKNVSMFGTALKVAPEDMKRAQRALSQMMSKDKVMAEELKMQLGDALPGAVQVFARALKMSEAELFKQMEQGKLLASEVLPKVAAEYKKAAKEGGAYDTALQGLRVTEGRLITQSQKAGDTIFKSGFSEGLSDLYETISELLKDAAPQLRKIGHVFGLVFKGLARALEILTPILSAAIDHMGTLFGAFMLSKMGGFILMMTKLTKAFKVFGTVSAASWAMAAAPIAGFVASLGLIDDWFAQFDRFKVSSDEAERGYQIVDGKRVGIEQRDGKWYNTGKTQDSQGESYWLHKAMASTFGDKAMTNNITVNIDGQEVAKHTETRLLNGASSAPSN